ncbi:hypothetical protein TRFO_38207 [Tritrichomonas foetus]|uniref:Uncharacterized protein n=1 Tax=Tritrichomonas foetus TaxID=1144522 RepID=A0A1J4JDX9_9EUKA|nr:hypothetical protein TRFO_38207 [Tritrichomonas foetus]|eukprot:OHS95645.1 hypothetical protein TRFO_38207 [Tritrichomonas foetus]
MGFSSKHFRIKVHFVLNFSVFQKNFSLKSRKVTKPKHLMSHRKSTQNTSGEDEHDFSDFRPVKKQAGAVAALKYLPFALITSLVSVLLYVAVRGLDLATQIPYVIAGYVAGVVGLVFAYYNVARWVTKQRSIQLKTTYEGSESLWFTLFYNNALYVFFLFLCSHVIFSSVAAQTSLVLTQVVASSIPALLSSFSV